MLPSPGETGSLPECQVQKQQTAVLPAQAAALGHPAAPSSPFLSPRLSPAERLAFRQAGKAPGQPSPDKGGEAPGQPPPDEGGEAPGQRACPPQLRLLWKAKVSGLRQPSAHREALGALTSPPPTFLPLLICPSPSCDVCGGWKGRRSWGKGRKRLHPKTRSTH